MPLDASLARTLTRKVLAAEWEVPVRKRAGRIRSPGAGPRGGARGHQSGQR